MAPLGAPASPLASARVLLALPRAPRASQPRRSGRPFATQLREDLAVRLGWLARGARMERRCNVARLSRQTSGPSPMLHEVGSYYSVHAAALPSYISFVFPLLSFLMTNARDGFARALPRERSTTSPLRGASETARLFDGKGGQHRRACPSLSSNRGPLIERTIQLVRPLQGRFGRPSLPPRAYWVHPGIHG